MTTAACPHDAAESLDQCLQAAVIAALETLVALTANREEPNQARLAAAEILRFAARRKPEPPKRVARPAYAPRAVTSGLGAMLDLLTACPRPDPEPEPDGEAMMADAPDPAPESTPAEWPDGAAAAPEPTIERSPAEQPPGRSPEPTTLPPPRTFFPSARKRKRERQRAARAGAQHTA